MGWQAFEPQQVGTLLYLDNKYNISKVAVATGIVTLLEPCYTDKR
jgi:hypothetical protein